jgi:hypothetical protein
MSILTKEDRKDLVYACRKALLEQVRTKGVLTESKKAAAENFILNEATYEQLLNLTYNPQRETNYLKTEALEKVALEAYAAHLTAKKTAVKEAAKKEVKKVPPKKEAAKKEVKKESQFKKLEEGFGQTLSKPVRKLGQKIAAKGSAIGLKGAGMDNVAKGIKTHATGAKIEKLGKGIQKHAGKITAGAGVGTLATGGLAARRMAKGKKEEK